MTALFPTNEELRLRQAEIERLVLGVREAWNNPEINHGDSCWQEEVNWDDLAGEYDANWFLLCVEPGDLD